MIVVEPGRWVRPKVAAGASSPGRDVDVKAEGLSGLAEPHEGEPGSIGYEQSGPQRDSTVNQPGAPLASRGGGWYHRVSAAGWSSLVARRAHNPKVVGSNPTPATFQPRFGL